MRNKGELPLGRQYAGRRVTCVPVIVSGQLSTGTFSEETEARMTTLNGALLSLSAALSAGQVVLLKNRLTRREQACRVLFVDPTPEAKRILLAVEFLESSHDFWRFEPIDLDE
jgi:hypothetical protein